MYLKKFSSLYNKFLISKTPQMNLVWGFLIYTIIGFVLLSIPFFHKIKISLIDNLFIATSAISTTGLVTIDIYQSYNFIGQFIIMSLIQIGGIGYMTLTTYYLLLTTRRITKWHSKLIGTEFTIPKSINIKDFIKSVIVFTLLMEVLGTFLFFLVFKNDMNTLKALWFSLFHSISTFCTAGFSLFENSFIGYKDNSFLNVIISILAISGSLGFIVITDLWYRITQRSKNISFTTKVIIYGFIILLASGTLITYFSEIRTTETTNPFLISFFQVMSAMTTVGFNTITYNQLSLHTLLLFIFIMYIGASPSGTAGGMKITTLTAMIAVLKSRLLGEKEITFFNRKIPWERVYVATSTFIMYTSLIFLFSFLFSFSENFSFKEILFEVSSALGTVGLSTGITSQLSMFGKSLIIILMFIGRVGVLTFGFALLKQRSDLKKIKSEDLAV